MLVLSEVCRDGRSGGAVEKGGREDSMFLINHNCAYKCAGILF